MEREHPNLLDFAGAAMWDLVERYTGKVGYRGGVKADGLDATPPVIDCSGWVSLLLSTGMKAVNDCGREKFGINDIANVFFWSVSHYSGNPGTDGHYSRRRPNSTRKSSRFATVGLRQGGGDWAKITPGPGHHSHRADRRAPN